jgi:hypothetical protein
MSKLRDNIKERDIIKRINNIRIFGNSLSGSYNQVVALVLILISIFILGGGMYDVIIQPLILLPTSTTTQFFYFGLRNQSLTESLVFMVLLTIGISGLYLSFRSSKLIYRPREASIMLFIGIALIITAFLCCEYILILKQVV